MVPARGGGQSGSRPRCWPPSEATLAHRPAPLGAPSTSARTVPGVGRASVAGLGCLLVHPLFDSSVSLAQNAGYVGDCLAGVAAASAAIVAAFKLRPLLRDRRAIAAVQKETALADARLAAAAAEDYRLERVRYIRGWARGMNEVYHVRNVDQPEDMSNAMRELQEGSPTAYVLLAVDEGGSDENRAEALRRLVTSEHCLAKAPTAAEYEALERARGLTASASARDSWGARTPGTVAGPTRTAPPATR